MKHNLLCAFSCAGFGMLAFCMPVSAQIAAGADINTSQKAGADSDAGWIAYTRGKILFVKYFPVFAQGNYSDGGNTVAFDCHSRGVELQPLSPETTLKGGGTYSFPEKWTLIELVDEVTTYEKARALVKQHIPPSPFAK